MTFTFSQFAFVEPAKILTYLLDLNHPVGKEKAYFFMRFGFSPVNSLEFGQALVFQGQTQTLTSTKPTPFGTIFQVDCNIISPDGRSPCIRTVWELRTGSQTPRLITAHPGKLQLST